MARSDAAAPAARRQWLKQAAGWVALPLGATAGPVLAQAPARKPLAAMTEGPFYPPARWRGTDGDWDADLTRVRNLGAVQTARGEHLGLALQVIDTQGRSLDAVETEIWQCDVQAVYRHPSQQREAERADPGFQGFGAARTDGQGRVAFRTIRPVPYPGRTPHIHFKLRHPSFGELTSQLFLAGDPGNGGDFLWRRLGADAQAALAMRLERSSESGLPWRAAHLLVVPA